MDIFDSPMCRCTMVPFSPTGLEAMEVGDILIDPLGEKKIVLEVLTQSCLVTFDDTDMIADCWCTFKELEHENWKLKGQDDKSEDLTELTLEEISEKFDIPLNKLRIKDK